MSPDNQVIVAGDPSSVYTLEFRNYDDDAWYSVSAVPENGGEALRIKFMSFADAHDHVFQTSHFKSLKELEDFKNRLRPVSLQLQDYECSSIVPGMKVVACHRNGDEDIRFYDAIVDEVQEKEHSSSEGEEVCLCTFSLYWLHGRAAETCSNSAVADICKIQPTTEQDPVVASFLKLARDRLEVTSSNSNSYSKLGSRCDVVPLRDGSQHTRHKRGFFERLHRETRCARRSVLQSPQSTNSERTDKHFGRRPEDRDLGGGMKNQCVILIGNLEKTISPPTIEEFLQRQTSVSPRVYVFPSLSSELFTRGVIFLDYESDFQKLCSFLDDPNHIIISSTGRPWVITGRIVGLRNIKASMGTLMPTSEMNFQKESSGESNDLRIVYPGTREFKTASELRGLFMEFSAHQEQLHKRLEFEEGTVFLSCPI